jgi:hypothetical protein
MAALLREDMGGGGWQSLAVVGIDPNDNIYPIAIVVVEETNDSWPWFLKILVVDLGSNGSIGWTFISDRQNVCLFALFEY